MTNLLIGISAVVNFLLAFLTIQKGRSLKNRSFAFLSFSIGLWAAPFILYDQPLIFNSLFWIRVIYVLVILMVGALYYFCFAFPDNERPPVWSLVAYVLLNLVTVYLLFYTNTFVTGVKTSLYGPETELGIGYLWVFPCWIFFILYGISNLIRKFMQASGTVKLQLLYIFIGLVIFFVGAIILDAIIPIFFNSSAYFSLSAVCSLFFVVLASYAVIRHRLMDIKIALQSIIVYVLTAAIIFWIIAGLATVFWVTTHVPIRNEAFPIIGVMSLVLTLFFGRISAFSKYLAGTYLFQSIYDYNTAVKQLSRLLSQYLNLEDLVEVIYRSLDSNLRATKIAVLIKWNNNFVPQKVLGFKDEELINLAHDNTLLSYLIIEKKVVDREELGSLAAEATQSSMQSNFSLLYSQLDKLGIALIVPIITSDQLISFVALGDKRGGGAYTVEDINLLNIIASQSAIALENARLYSEVSTLNKDLQRRVDLATKDLIDANMKLQELDRLKDDFVSIASHELRTPMTAIRSYAWMALNKSDIPLSDKLKRYLDRVLISTERLINLVNDMLNISRIESGRVEITPREFDIVTLVQDVLSEVSAKAGERKIILKNAVADHLPPVFADMDKVHQILLNLIGNALKFTPEEGTVTIAYFADGQQLDVSITDTGVGIAKEDLSRLFTRFGRLDNSYVAAATSGGTGLGLYISKILVELLQGRIWANSNGPGKGSTFSFSLPIATPVVLQHPEKYTMHVEGESKALEPVSL